MKKLKLSFKILGRPNTTQGVGDRHHFLGGGIFTWSWVHTVRQSPGTKVLEVGQPEVSFQFSTANSHFRFPKKTSGVDIF